MPKLSNIWDSLSDLVADMRTAFQTHACGHSAMDAEALKAQKDEIEIEPGIYILPPPPKPALSAEELRRNKWDSIRHSAVETRFVDVEPKRPTFH